MTKQPFTPVDSVSLEQWLDTLPVEERAVAEARMRARIASRMGLGILENGYKDGKILWRATWEAAYRNVCQWLQYFMASDEERRQLGALYDRWCDAQDAERKARENGRNREAREHEREADALSAQREAWGRDMYSRPLPEPWDSRYPRYLALLETEHERGRREDRERAERQATIDRIKASLAEKAPKKLARAKR